MRQNLSKTLLAILIIFFVGFLVTYVYSLRSDRHSFSLPVLFWDTNLSSADLSGSEFAEAKYFFETYNDNPIQSLGHLIITHRIQMTKKQFGTHGPIYFYKLYTFFNIPFREVNYSIGGARMEFDPVFEY